LQNLHDGPLLRRGAGITLYVLTRHLLVTSLMRKLQLSDEWTGYISMDLFWIPFSYLQWEAF